MATYLDRFALVGGVGCRILRRKGDEVAEHHALLVLLDFEGIALFRLTEEPAKLCNRDAVCDMRTCVLASINSQCIHGMDRRFGRFLSEVHEVGVSMHMPAQTSLGSRIGARLSVTPLAQIQIAVGSLLASRNSQCAVLQYMLRATQYVCGEQM